jgi:uncharacterized repeat protein (TIGR01451 family)
MVTRAPVWVVSKSAGAAVVDTGGQVTFSSTLQTLGNGPATGVVVTDTLPPELQLLSADNGATVDKAANAVAWNPGTVEPGAAALTLTLTARMLAANSTVTNAAQLGSNELPAVTVRAEGAGGEAGNETVTFVPAYGCSSRGRRTRLPMDSASRPPG